MAAGMQGLAAQTTYFWGAATAEQSAALPNDFLSSRSQGDAAQMWAIIQRSLVIKMDESTLSRGTSAPRPVALLIPTGNAQQSHAAFTAELTDEASAVSQWLDPASNWPMLMATAAGQPIKTLAPQALNWTFEGDVTELLASYPAAVSPQAMTTLVSLPMSFEVIETANVSGADYVLAIFLAAPFAGEQATGTGEVLLIFF